MTGKTLGQIAYEAWGAVVWDGDAGEYDHVVAPGWEAAAEAVRAETINQAAINEQEFYSPMSPIRDEERAVIEAARKCRRALRLLNDSNARLYGAGLENEWVRLEVALGALEEMERD